MILNSQLCFFAGLDPSEEFRVQKSSGKLEDNNNCPFERLFMAQPALLIDCSSLADVNECLTGLAMCAHQCLNTRGSFKCTCNPGYELGADGKQCYREYRVQSPPQAGLLCRQVFVLGPLGIGGAEFQQSFFEEFHKQVWRSLLSHQDKKTLSDL